jgi:hypothetical protein
LTSCIAALSIACGEEEPAPVAPEMTGLELECADSDQSGVDSQVLQMVSVMVTDDDRDLVGVDGTINGLQITLLDDDADELFTWSPPDSNEPMVCDGDFAVSLEAFDDAGNKTELYEIVEK